jgi:hypothetical protein
MKQFVRSGVLMYVFWNIWRCRIFLLTSRVGLTPQGGFSANEIYDMLRERDFALKEIPKVQKYTIIDKTLNYKRKKAH